MKFPSTASSVLLLALALIPLTGCGGGGGDDAFGSEQDPATQNPGTTDPQDPQDPAAEVPDVPGANTADSIIITYPLSDAIVDSKAGWYRQKISLLLQDKHGKPVADGTVVDLRVIDSIIVQGSTTSGDTISGTDMDLPNATEGDGSTPAQMTTAVVNRPGLIGGQNRGIEAGDLVLLQDNVFYKDVMRTLASAPTLANTLTVSSAFEKSYPGYDDVSYLVGASMLSAAILGEEAGKLTPGVVRVSGGTGTATAWIRYAANPEYIRTGCNPAIDTRIDPVGSAQVYVVASAGDITAVEQFCFSEIAGYTVTPLFPNLSVDIGGTDSTPICVEDGGDGVPVPFAPIIGRKSDGAVGAVVTYPTHTGVDGCFVAQFADVTGASGDSGKWTFVVGRDGTAEVNVKIQ